MGFPAGSGVDVVARLLQGPIEKELGNTAALRLQGRRRRQCRLRSGTKARCDGYTILLGTSATHGINAAL